MRPPFWVLLFDTPTRDVEPGPSSRSPRALASPRQAKSRGFAQNGALGLDDDYLPGARPHDKIRIVVDKAIDGETRSRDIAMPPPDIW